MRRIGNAEFEVEKYIEEIFQICKLPIVDGIGVSQGEAENAGAVEHNVEIESTRRKKKRSRS